MTDNTGNPTMGTLPNSSNHTRITDDNGKLLFEFEVVKIVDPHAPPNERTSFRVHFRTNPAAMPFVDMFNWATPGKAVKRAQELQGMLTN